MPNLKRELPTRPLTPTTDPGSVHKSSSSRAPSVSSSQGRPSSPDMVQDLSVKSKKPRPYDPPRTPDSANSLPSRSSSVERKDPSSLSNTSFGGKDPKSLPPTGRCTKNDSLLQIYTLVN